MHPTDQPLKNQKIQAEDVAYAAYHDTVYDVGEELLKYEKCAVLSDVKLQAAFDELDVLKNSVDTAYQVLLDAKSGVRDSYGKCTSCRCGKFMGKV